MREAKVASAAEGVLTGELHEGFPVRRYPPGPRPLPDPILVREPAMPADFDAVGPSTRPRIATTTAPSEVLAANLEALGHPRPPGHDAHHIVLESGGGEAGDQARKILAEAGISINGGENAIWLPRTSLDPDAIPAATSSHHPIHTSEYLQNVLRRLEQAAERGPQAVADELAAIYQILLENPNALSQ
jgi:hypothetical protein